MRLLSPFPASILIFSTSLIACGAENETGGTESSGSPSSGGPGSVQGPSTVQMPATPSAGTGGLGTGGMGTGGQGGEGGAASGGIGEEGEEMTFVRNFLETQLCFECHAHAEGEEADLPTVFWNDDSLHEVLLTRTVEDCEGRALVVPGDPENSALYLALFLDSVDQGTAVSTCGELTQMPYGCFEELDGSINYCSSYEDRERLRLWIAAGAPK